MSNTANEDPTGCLFTLIGHFFKRSTSGRSVSLFIVTFGSCAENEMINQLNRSIERFFVDVSSMNICTGIELTVLKGSKQCYNAGIQ